MDMVCMTLAGRASEEIFFEKVPPPFLPLSLASLASRPPSASTFHSATCRFPHPIPSRRLLSMPFLHLTLISLSAGVPPSQVTTGASDDLRKVTQIVYQMIQVYGMNDRIGNLAFPKQVRVGGRELCLSLSLPTFFPSPKGTA